MKSIIANRDRSTFRADEMTCPYNGVTVCIASFSSMTIDKRKKEDFCATENYDTCPLFISKVLRRNRG
jgi:hypothetical protein